MNQTIVLTILVLLLKLPPIPTEARNSHFQNTISDTDMIILNHDNRELFCYIAYPENERDVPGVIVIHEDWGMTDWIESFSDEIAALGYLVIAPDLLSGCEPEKNTTKDFMNEDMARRSLLKIDPDQIMSDLDAVFQYLKADSLCNGKIVIIGFSWGGSQVFNYMANNHDLSAGFVFYGKSPENKNDLERIVEPVYGFYGEYDSRINPSVWKTDRIMKQLGKTFEPVIFEGGGHGFMRSGERPGANEGNIKARSAAWKRLTELLSGIKNVSNASKPF
jgi:carboxymethylenebutenolidase